MALRCPRYGFVTPGSKCGAQQRDQGLPDEFELTQARTNQQLASSIEPPALIREVDIMSYDLLIKNGTVVDGTGSPRRMADIAVRDGVIVEIGKIKDGAAKTIDADGLIVAPGFVDPHTHYDAQICWDPQITSSSWHGVTSVVMGNCGVGLAPCRPQAHDIAAHDLVNVEAIPYEVLKRGITWDWESFPSYLQAAGRRGSAINLGFLAPLTPFRHYVMGEESMERTATADETAKSPRCCARQWRPARLVGRIPPAFSTWVTKGVRWLAAWPTARSWARMRTCCATSARAS
jgi:hypothetical protein